MARRLTETQTQSHGLRQMREALVSAVLYDTGREILHPLATTQDKLSIGRSTASELLMVALASSRAATAHDPTQDDGWRHPHRVAPSIERGRFGRGRRHGHS